VSNEKEFLYTKTEADLREALARQVRHLRRSFDAYDNGHHEEAERIAAVIYILVHDDNSSRKIRSRSLLGQLSEKGRMRFAQTSGVDLRERIAPNQWRTPTPLCAPTVKGGVGVYVPIGGNFLHGRLSMVPFSEWWEQPIMENPYGNTLSRKNLVFALRTKDGGGHIDPNITDGVYHWASSGRSAGYRVTSDGVEIGQPLPLGHNGKGALPPDYIRIPNAHWATMRQIGWELEVSMGECGLLENWLSFEAFLARTPRP